MTDRRPIISETDALAGVDGILNAQSVRQAGLLAQSLRSAGRLPKGIHSQIQEALAEVKHNLGGESVRTDVITGQDYSW